MMDFAGFTGFENQADLTTLVLRHQVLVNASDGKQATHRHSVHGQLSVAEDD